MHVMKKLDFTRFAFKMSVGCISCIGTPEMQIELDDFSDSNPDMNNQSGRSLDF